MVDTQVMHCGMRVAKGCCVGGLFYCRNFSFHSSCHSWFLSVFLPHDHRLVHSNIVSGPHGACEPPFGYGLCRGKTPEPLKESFYVEFSLWILWADQSRTCVCVSVSLFVVKLKQWHLVTFKSSLLEQRWGHVPSSSAPLTPQTACNFISMNNKNQFGVVHSPRPGPRTEDWLFFQRLRNVRPSVRPSYADRFSENTQISTHAWSAPKTSVVT